MMTHDYWPLGGKLTTKARGLSSRGPVLGTGLSFLVSNALAGTKIWGLINDYGLSYNITSEQVTTVKKMQDCIHDLGSTSHITDIRSSHLKVQLKHLRSSTLKEGSAKPL
jgi:hypothetical protein